MTTYKRRIILEDEVEARNEEVALQAARKKAGAYRDESAIDMEIAGTEVKEAEGE